MHAHIPMMTAQKYTPAPFLRNLAEAPQDANAVWVTAPDGIRLRLGVLATGERGTVLLFQGRTEYLEKYGRAAARFAARGYGVVAVDFRGQGLSQRLAEDRLIGHVDDFDDYQTDVAALVAYAEAQKMPRPWFLLGHSLGGAIGLRALVEGLEVEKAVFSAPMWGIAMLQILRPVSYGLGWIAHKADMDWWITPGMSRDPYVCNADPADNLLTHDPEMLSYMRRHLNAEPEMGLGGPSVAWLYRALMECRSLRTIISPPVPTLTFLPTEDNIVSQDAMRLLTQRWPNSDLITVDGGAHETMMETSERQNMFFSTTMDFFDAPARPCARQADVRL